ncbi:hypothetical protein AVW11_06810 [Streptomyces amritsarensis]|uniref:Uncharacterized protein n=1 Tax=Streptomyces amritsarensis TaxID=681158 RepID=A0ABX3G6U6_9ACTN|nr:hypothetical protein AVW11_06810 [Streptomyces amritsarensis]
MRPISVVTINAVRTWSSTHRAPPDLPPRNRVSFSRQYGDSRHREPLGPPETDAAAAPSRLGWCRCRLTRRRRAASDGLA